MRCDTCVECLCGVFLCVCGRDCVVTGCVYVCVFDVSVPVYVSLYVCMRLCVDVIALHAVCVCLLWA